MFESEDDMPFVRVPVIATANSAKEVYSPILRHGRARLFHWEPTQQDRMQMALVQLARIGREDVRYLAEKYKAEPPVFFRELVNRVFERALIRLFRADKTPTREAVIALVKELRVADIDHVATEVKKSEVLRSLKFDG